MNRMETIEIQYRNFAINRNRTFHAVINLKCTSRHCKIIILPLCATQVTVGVLIEYLTSILLCGLALSWIICVV